MPVAMGSLSILALVAFQTKTQNHSVLAIAISQIAPLPPVVALNRNSKSQIATRHAAFGTQFPQIALASFLECL